MRVKESNDSANCQRSLQLHRFFIWNIYLYTYIQLLLTKIYRVQYKFVCENLSNKNKINFLRLIRTRKNYFRFGRFLISFFSIAKYIRNVCTWWMYICTKCIFLLFNNSLLNFVVVVEISQVAAISARQSQRVASSVVYFIFYIYLFIFFFRNLGQNWLRQATW